MAALAYKEWVDKLRRTELGRAVESRSRQLGRDLGLDEFTTLVRQDTRRAYSFYQAEQGSRPRVLPARGFRRLAILSKAVFLSFLKKLTPARRLAYLVAVVLFARGFWLRDWSGALIGFVVLNVLLAIELAEKLLTKDELEIARAIQFSLYPAANPELGKLDVASFFRPARDVGGDYYDFALDERHRLTVILGDVSGKGIPAALYAMKLQALFELLGKRELSPKEMLVSMNDVISQRIERNYFITALVARLDFEGQRLVLARAGHNHPLHYSLATDSTRWLKPGGVGIGMKKPPIFDGLLEEAEVPLHPGDIVLFYTDGVTETMNARDEAFGYERLETLLKASSHLPAEEIKRSLLRALNDFRLERPFDDDVTFVVTKVPLRGPVH
jgi:serine phosphatase RsbU (regulator of sigma subunit)